MRIPPRESPPDRMDKLRVEIAEAVCPAATDGRVCGETCAFACPQCGSTACQCTCSPDCAEASRALSADPDHYPIEPGILPLVFEMKRLGFFRPCWSCEGHLGTDGALWKLPRVWFYCSSTAQLRLLGDGIKDLQLEGKLSAQWHIVVTFSDSDNPDTTFSLEPADHTKDAALLPGLQNDALVIARSLEALMTGQAKKLQQTLDEALARDT
ncbi:MAG: hypothetical protein HOM58_04645 [Rhodospirillaceae bacterium]|jgi:hypothetical protein|nr:hypothetical protein [Rhodospirillaceae bacterium]MBT5459711.1 hypothetical protein [Rhodospirillaceae bacterium]